MKTTIISAVLILGLCGPLSSQADSGRNAFEVLLSDIRLPRNVDGTIAFKACRTCAYKVKRVSADTSYLLDGKRVSLAEFRAAMNLVENQRREAVTIMQHETEGRVTAVKVYL